MATKNNLRNNYEQHIFLSQVAEDLGRYGHTDIKCPECDGEFSILVTGSSYEIRCETDDCIKFTSRGI